MRTLVPIGFCALLGLNVVPAFAQEAQIVLTVVDELGDPFPDVRVEVRLELPVRSARDLQPPTRLVAIATTDAAGTTAIRLQPFRSYRTRVVRPGYTTSEPWDRLFWATPGEAVMAPYRLSALFDVPVDSNNRASPPLPRGVLSGRVLSTTGEPVGNVTVTIISNTYTATDVRTKADGSYRVTLAPGTYTVNTTGSLAVPLPLRSRQTLVVFDRAPKAVRAVVSPRETTTAPDVVVTPVRLFNARVTVLDEEGHPLPGAHVRYTAVGKAPAYSYSGDFPTSGDGSLMLGPLVPGDVHVIASASKGAAHLAASTTFKIVDAPQTFTLQLRTAARVTGRVEFIGRAAPLTGGGLRVHDVGLDGAARSHPLNDRAGEVGPDGVFTLTNLIGDRCLKVDGVSHGWRLVAITHYGDDYTNRPFHLEAGEEISGVLVRFETGTAESDSRRCSD